METIWKYLIENPQTTLVMPRGAHIFSTGIQGNALVVWAHVLPGAPEVPRRVRAVNTGETLADDALSGATFVGTVTHRNGIVWHVFAWAEEDTSS